MDQARVKGSAGQAGQDDGHKPMSKSYAAGFSSDNELSSLRGVRHFWQYMVAGVHTRRRLQ